VEAVFQKDDAASHAASRVAAGNQFQTERTGNPGKKYCFNGAA
jgi:hypothetical protein